MSAGAIVLAGGRSSRFGRDKLAEPLDGWTVLERTVAAVRAVAVDVVVVAAAGASPTVPEGVRLATDPLPEGGPLVGVVAGLEAARHDVVLVVGGDMPWSVPAVLQELVDVLAGEGAATATAAALDVGGRVQQLPMALRRAPALAATRVLLAAGTRRLGALQDVLEVAVIREARWRILDPEAATLRDVDEPGDLPTAGT